MAASTLDMQTVLFADIANSARLYEQLGDARALALVTGCLQIVETATAAQQGRIIKTIGDEVMGCFALPGQAVAAMRVSNCGATSSCWSTRAPTALISCRGRRAPC